MEKSEELAEHAHAREAPDEALEVDWVFGHHLLLWAKAKQAYEAHFNLHADAYAFFSLFLGQGPHENKGEYIRDPNKNHNCLSSYRHVFEYEGTKDVWPNTHSHDEF